tara:strand:+ start:192 stop:623 length:432 start_codon:yes stop_codon:yes gene_type:complete
MEHSMKPKKFNPEIEKVVDASLIMFPKEEVYEDLWNMWLEYLNSFYGYDVNNTLTQLDCDSSIVFNNNDVYKAFQRIYCSFQLSTNPQPFLFCPDVQKAVIAFQLELQKIKNQEKLTEAIKDTTDLGKVSDILPFVKFRSTSW